MIMKRVLLVSPELQYTGACQSFRRVCKVLLKNHFAVDVWSYMDGPFKDEFTKIGVAVRIVEQMAIDEEFIAREVMKYNLVIANTIVTYKVADYSQKYIPVVWYIREAENIPDFLWEKRCEIALRRAKKLYCVSEYAQHFIREHYNKNTYVVHNYVEDVFEQYQSLRASDGKIRFLALGTIEKRKGYDVLVQAFLSLPKEIRAQCELHFAGRLWDGAKDFYPDILRAAEANEDILYHGELRDRDAIHQLIAKSSVIVVPSLDESCSLVALEGAMLAKPLILSMNIGAKYVLSEENGWLIRSGNVEALAEAFTEAISSKDQLMEMGMISRKKYLETSTRDIYEKNILQMVSDNICEEPYLYFIQDKMYELFTFDIFDTLITRCVPQSWHIFLEVQHSLQMHCDRPGIQKSLIGNFAYIRRDTERFMYRRVCDNQKGEITLDEIYDFISRDYFLDSADKEYIKQLEIEVETRTMTPIMRGINIVKHLKREGRRVALISDMYLDSETIRTFLTTVDRVFRDIPIYVSCEYSKKKNTGALFETVRREEKVSYSQWSHCGDNWNGDFVQPSALGISSIYMESVSALTYETMMLSDGHVSREKLYTVGTSRRLRTEFQNDKQTYGISFGGPFFFPYVYWVIGQSRRMGIDELYFVARDGAILKGIADAILTETGEQVHTHYIYGSRVAWKMPYETQNAEDLELLIRYIEQEIDTQKPFAFVEFAGTGVTQDTLYLSMPEEVRRNWVCTFYMYHSRNPIEMTSRIYSMIRPGNSFDTCTELLARAPHGQTEGYALKDGIVVPIMDEAEGEAICHYGYQDYIDGAVLFASAYAEACQRFELDPCSLEIQQFYYDHLTGDTPDRGLITFLAAIPFQLDGLVEMPKPYAPPLTESEYNDITLEKMAVYKGERLKWSIMLSGTARDDADSEELKKQNRHLMREIDILCNSVSYRTGLLITWIPRKVRGGIQCYKDNGFDYTWRHLLQKVWNRLRFYTNRLFI